MLSNNLRGALWITLSGVVATVMSSGIKSLDGEIQSMQIAFMRCALGVLFVLPLVFGRHIRENMGLPPGETISLRSRMHLSPRWPLHVIRGLLAAAWASLAALAFGWLFPEGIASASFADKQEALRDIILGYSAITFVAGVFVWFALKHPHGGEGEHLEEWDPERESVGQHIAQVMRMPAVWMIAIIVICAYVAYKGFDNYSLYAVQAWRLTEVEAAQLVSIGAWMRPVAALGIGLLGDRYLVSRMTVITFAALLASQLCFAILTPQPGLGWVLLLNILLGSAAMFGLRALYFALFEEAKVPATVTGTAVGLVSVLGYTPDIFVSYVGGVILDRSPGLAGHQHYFGFLAAFAALGLAVSAALLRMLSIHRKQPSQAAQSLQE